MDKSIWISISKVERTEGPMYKTHHWRLGIAVGEESVYTGWFYTRAGAIEDISYQLEIRGIATVLDYP